MKLNKVIHVLEKLTVASASPGHNSICLEFLAQDLLDIVPEVITLLQSLGGEIVGSTIPGVRRSS